MSESVNTRGSREPHELAEELRRLRTRFDEFRGRL